MFFDCSAEFIVYALLSSFEAIAEADRDAVEYALELVASYVSNYNYLSPSLLVYHCIH